MVLIFPAEPKEFLERTIGFTINYTRDDPHDPRELSEFPDIRLWFVRLDATYPWLPVLLDWRAGELARYAAMLVPHQVIWVEIKYAIETDGSFSWPNNVSILLLYMLADEYENGSCV